GAVPRYLVTSFLLDQFENGDQRLLEWIGETTVNDTHYRYPYKYKNKSASEVPTENYMIFRLGEMILTRAEAAAHLNNLDQAIKDINVVRKRAGLLEIPMDERSQEDVLDAVMKERQTELCFEWGYRWFDLKRNVTDASSASSVLHTHKSGYKPTSNLYPIPQAQRDLNNLLEQNKGYNEHYTHNLIHMKKTKLLGIAITIILFMIQFTSYSQNTVLKGQLKGLSDGEVTLHYNNKSQSITDTVKAVDDHFEWKSNLDEPVRVALNAGKEHFFFFAEPGQLTLVGIKDSLSTYNLKGSLMQEHEDLYRASTRN